MVTSVDVLNFFHAPIILTHVLLSEIILKLIKLHKFRAKSNKRLSSSVKKIFERNSNECLSSYSDANVASDCDNNSRCTSGSIILYSESPVSWKSELQTLLSFSTVKNELLALGLVTADTI